MAAIDPPTSPMSAWQWWESQRLRYGLILVGVGLLGFAMEATVMLTFSPAGQMARPLWPMFLGQGLLYTVYMVIAHVCYLLGAVVESLVRPQPVAAYRRYAWTLGTIAAAGLPLMAAMVICLVMMLGGTGLEGF